MPDSLRSLVYLTGGIALFGVAGGLIALGVDPVAALLIPLALGLVAWFASERRVVIRRERAERGQCVRCGYDLTANVSGVCPECGGPTG